METVTGPRRESGAADGWPTLPPVGPRGMVSRMEGLVAAERRLLEAQRRGDVEALDELLHPDVVAIGPDGSTFTKEDDLDAYRSGALRITSLVERSVEVRDDGPSGVSRTVVDIEAVQGGAPAAARFGYTRLWVVADGRWQVLAAAFGPVEARDDPGPAPGRSPG